MAGIDAPRARLSWMGLLAALAVVSAGVSRADTWAAPQDAAYYSENGRYEFLVQLRDPKQVINRSTGTLRRKGAGSEQVWAQPLVNRVCPVSAMVTDSGKYVVTFDEHHSVGRNPVVTRGLSRL